MSANQFGDSCCGTCAHYSGEHCAINRSTPMQHKICSASWACPAWQAVERHGITCICVTCEQERHAALVEQRRRA